MKRRVLSIITVFALLIALVPQNITVSYAAALSGSGTASDPYLIKNSSDLEQIGDGEAGTYYKLENHITIDRSFKTIKSFKGILNGNYKTITGLDVYTHMTYDTASQKNILTTKGALFETIESTALVYRVTFRRPKFSSYCENIPKNHNGDLNFNRGLLAVTNKGTVDNISITDADINATFYRNMSTCESIYQTNNFGGIVYQNNGKILNCYITGNMKVTDGEHMAGVVSMNNGIVANVESYVKIELTQTSGFSGPCLRYASCIVSRNTGTIYNSWSGGSISSTYGNLVESQINGYICAANTSLNGKVNGTVDTCYYKKTSDEKVVAAGVTGGNQSNVEEKSIGTNKDLYNANVTANNNKGANGIMGLKGWQASVEPAILNWVKDGKVYKCETVYPNDDGKWVFYYPYAIDDDYYTETWDTTFSESGMQGLRAGGYSTFNSAKVITITAANPQGKYYPVFDGTQTLTPSETSIPDYAYKWKRVGSDDFVEAPTADEIAQAGGIKKYIAKLDGGYLSDSYFTENYTDPISVGDEFAVKYVVDSNQYKIKSGEYYMYTKGGWGNVDAPTFKVKKISVAQDNINTYFDFTQPTVQKYSKNAVYAYPTVSAKTTATPAYTGTLTVRYSKEDGTVLDAPPTEAGTYNVLVSMKADDNFKACTNVKIGTFTIEKGDVKCELSIEGEAKYSVPFKIKAKFTEDCDPSVKSENISGGYATLYINGIQDGLPTWVSNGEVTFVVSKIIPVSSSFNYSVKYDGNGNSYNTKEFNASGVVAQGTPEMEITTDKTDYTYGDTAIITVKAPANQNNFDSRLVIRFEDTNIPLETDYIEDENGYYKYKWKVSRVGENISIKADFIGSQNYNAGYVTCTYSAYKADVTADLLEVTGSGTYTYDGQSKSVAINPKAGIKGIGNVVNIYYYSQTDGTSSQDAPVDAGTYELFVEIEAGENYNANSFLKVSPILIIKQATLTENDFTVKINGSDDRNFTYNGEPVDVQVTSPLTDTFDVTYYKKDENGNYNPMPDKPIVPGEYLIAVSAAESRNCKGFNLELCRFEITKCDLTAENCDWLNQSTHSYTYEDKFVIEGDFNNGLTPTGTFDIKLKDKTSGIDFANLPQFITLNDGKSFKIEINENHYQGSGDFELTVSYSGDDLVSYTPEFIKGEFSVARKNVTITVTGESQVYEPDTPRYVTVTSDAKHLQDYCIRITYYKVDENENKLVSADAVTNAISAGKYLYVVSIEPMARIFYQFSREYTVTGTALPNIDDYDNIGYMIIKAGSTDTQKPIYFDNSTVNAYMTDTVVNNLNNPNSSDVTYESKNTNVAEVDPLTGAVTIKGAGSAVIIATSKKENTSDVYASYTLNVTKELIQVKAANAEITYGTNTEDINYGYTLSKNVTLSGEAVYSTNYYYGSDCGKYDINISGFSSDVYDIVYVPATLIVMPKELTIDDFYVTAASKRYDGTKTAQFATAPNQNSLVSGDYVNALIEGEFENENASYSNKQTINYRITGLTGAESSNYYINGVLTGTAEGYIYPAFITVSVPPVTTYVYDGEAKYVNAVAYANGMYFDKFFAVYSKDGTNVAAPTDAGTYEVNIYTADSNYAISGGVTAQLIIKPAQQEFFTIEGIPDNVTYGDSFHLQTAGADGTVTYEITEGNEIASLNGDIITTSGIGKVTVKATNTKENYNQKTAQRSFVINKKTLTYTVTAKNKIYDGEKTVDIESIVLDGIVGNDEVSAAARGGAYTATADAENNKTVFVSGIELAGASSANYRILSDSAQTSINIAKKDITAVNISAFGKVYDGTANAEYFVESYSGVVPADLKFINVNGTAQFDNANAGDSKTVTLTNYTLTGAKSGNYNLNLAADPTSEADIVKAQVNFNIGALEYVYDGKQKSVPVTAVCGDRVFTGYKVTYNQSADMPINAGNYNVEITLNDSENYSSDFTGATLKILAADQANLTITGVAGTIDFGKIFMLQTVGGNGNGKVTWTSSDAGIAYVEADTGIVTIKGVGSPVTITAVKASDGNYTEQTANITFTPVKKSVGYKITGLTHTYDGTAKAVTVTGIGDYTVTYTDENGSEVPTPVNAGTYNVTVAAKEPYDGSASAVMTIKNASIDTSALTFDVADATYGEALNVTQPDLSAYPAGTSASVTYTGTGIYTPQTEQPKSAGRYTATLTISGDNYNGAQLTADFVINKAVINVTPKAVSRAYGELNPSFTMQYDGFKYNDDISAIMIEPTGYTEATLNSGVGSYDIIPSGGYAENYTFNYRNGTLTVGEASGGNFYIFGGQSNPYVGNKFTVTAYYNNEKPSVIWQSDNPSVAQIDADGVVTIVNNGTATITATMNDSRFASGLTASFTLNAEWLPETQTQIYFDTLTVDKYVTDGAFAIAPMGVDNGATVKYKSSNISVASVDETTGSVTLNKAGTAVITATASKFNCADVYASYTVNVKKVPVTVKANDVLLTYGDEFTTTDVTVTGANKDELNGTLSFATKYAKGKNVGDYDVMPSGLTSDIYDIIFESGTITVAEKVLTSDDFDITVSDKTYDGAREADVFASVKPGSLVSGDRIAVGVYANFIDENADTENKKDAEYVIDSISGKGFENYILHGGSVSGTIPGAAYITPAKVSFFVSKETVRSYDGSIQKAEVSAMALSRVFDESNYTVYYTGTDGVKTAQPVNADEYKISIELNDEFKGNYEAIQPDAVLKISIDETAKLYITGSNKNVTAGDVFTLYAHYGNEMPSVKWEVTEGSDVAVISDSGEVTVLKSGRAVIKATLTDENYGGGSTEFELVAAKKKISIKISASELVKTYTGSEQTINFTSDVPLDDVTIHTSYVLRTDASVTQPIDAGTYTVSYEVDDERYEASGNSEFTINKANVTVKAKDIQKQYGDKPEYELEIVSGENVADLNEMLSYVKFASDGADVKAKAGTYDIKLTLDTQGDKNRNFDVCDTLGKLTVTKAPLTVTVKDVTREYGAENPQLEAEIGGFKNGETVKDLSGELILGYDGIDAETAVGTHNDKATASGLESENYEIAYVFGNVTITKIKVSASILGARNTYIKVKFGKAVKGLTENNFEVKNGSETVTIASVSPSEDNKIYTINGKFDVDTTYTVNVLCPADSVYDISGSDLKVKPSKSSSSSGGGGGGSATVSYTVSFDTNGANKIDSVKVTKNSTVKEPSAPVKDGFKFDGWYTDKECNTLYDFSQRVNKSFTLYAKWTAKDESDNVDGKDNDSKDNNTPGGANENPFIDVKENDWFYDNVMYVVKNKIMSGTDENIFDPNGLVTRAMLVTVLWRADGMPQTDYIIPFSDVGADDYYTEAVRWAASEGIVNGISEKEFAPNRNITREQIATIMFRYAKYKKYDVLAGEDTNILSYTDAESISEYAVPAIQYAVGAGLMNGKTNNTINPQDNATRAEIAAIMQRFLK